MPREETDLPRDTKRNTKLVKAGLVLVAFAFGALPLIVAGAIVIKISAPVLNEMVVVASQGAGHPPVSTDAVRKKLSPAYLPQCYHQLLYSIARGWRGEKKVCDEMELPYQYGILASKVVWEHIRKTGSQEFDTPIVLRCDVLRKMGWEETNLFQEFCACHGNMTVERILRL